MLVGSYNFVLVAASYLIAAFASYVALDMAGRINATRGAVAHGWLTGGAIAMGFGIWSMHFVGILAFKLPIPQGYDLAITLYSLLIAICSSAYALNLASGAHLPPSRLAVGALILGSGIAAMHYVGMAAMQMQPGIDYHVGWLLVSVLIAVAAAGAALWIAFALRSEGRGVPYARLLAAAVMGVAVVGMEADAFADSGLETQAADDRDSAVQLIDDGDVDAALVPANDEGWELLANGTVSTTISTEDGPTEIGSVEWLGDTTVDARDLLGGDDTGTDASERTAAWLV